MTPIAFLYTNWRGETRLRAVTNMCLPRWGTSEWHPEPQWLFVAVDAETGEFREFALKDCDFTAREERA